MKCRKPGYIIFPLSAFISLFFAISYWALYHIIGPLTHDQVSAYVLFIADNLLVAFATLLALFILKRGITSVAPLVFCQTVLIIALICGCFATSKFLKDPTKAKIEEFFLEEYESTGEPSTFVRFLQSKSLDCCGVNGYKDYEKKNATEYKLPISCCKSNVSKEECKNNTLQNVEFHHSSPYVNYKGCLLSDLRGSMPEIYLIYQIVFGVPLFHCFLILLLIFVLNFEYRRTRREMEVINPHDVIVYPVGPQGELLNARNRESAFFSRLLRSRVSLLHLRRDHENNVVGMMKDQPSEISSDKTTCDSSKIDLSSHDF